MLKEYTVKTSDFIGIEKDGELLHIKVRFEDSSFCKHRITYSEFHDNDKSKYAGGGDKPASEKQIGLLKKISHERNIDISATCKRQFGKNIHEIKGGEANILIKQLKI